MAYCVKCNNKIPSSAKFCDECGAKNLVYRNKGNGGGVLTILLLFLLVVSIGALVYEYLEYSKIKQELANVKSELSENRSYALSIITDFSEQDNVNIKLKLEKDSLLNEIDNCKLQFENLSKTLETPAKPARLPLNQKILEEIRALFNRGELSCSSHWGYDENNRIMSYSARYPAEFNKVAVEHGCQF